MKRTRRATASAVGIAAIMPMSAPVSESQIAQANSQFWGPMLGVEMQLVAQEAADWIADSHVAGWCQLSGAWSGRIEVRLTHGLATMATSAMLALPEESVQEADVMDAVKEIANMIAGTIKSTLPRPCSMTVPEAVVDASAELAAASSSAQFQHDSGQIIVRLIEQG